MNLPSVMPESHLILSLNVVAHVATRKKEK